MPRTMNLWVLVGVVLCLLTASIVCISNLQGNANELNERREANQQRIVDLRNEQADLQNTLELAGTDEFIENQARSLYGYMMPDEIRFVITNSDVLYGDEKVPSR